MNTTIEYVFRIRNKLTGEYLFGGHGSKQGLFISEKGARSFLKTTNGLEWCLDRPEGKYFYSAEELDQELRKQLTIEVFALVPIGLSLPPLDNIYLSEGEKEAIKEYVFEHANELF